MIRVTSRPRGIPDRRAYRPPHAEPSALLLAPRVEDIVHPHHVTSEAGAEALALTRWLDLRATWRGPRAAPAGLRPTFRDRAAYAAAIAAHQSAQAAS